MLISNLTSSRLIDNMKDSILMAENSLHVEYVEEMISNIKTFIIWLLHRVGALISDI